MMSIHDLRVSPRRLWRKWDRRGIVWAIQVTYHPLVSLSHHSSPSAIRLAGPVRYELVEMI